MQSYEIATLLSGWRPIDLLALTLSVFAVVVNIALWWHHARTLSLAARKYPGEQAGGSNEGGPNPPPMHLVEASRRFTLARDCWPHLIGQENGRTVWVVVQYKHLPSPPPPPAFFKNADNSARGAA